MEGKEDKEENILRDKSDYKKQFLSLSTLGEEKEEVLEEVGGGREKKRKI